MKSRISFCDRAFFRAELRRFWPVCLLYTVGLLLLIVNFVGMASNTMQNTVYAAQNLSGMMAVVNIVYAFLLAQLFFGDLYSQKLSYAIHALPISRTTFYTTQLVLGFLFSLLPNLLGAALLQVFVPGFRILVLWWLAAAELQFVFFYGIACLSAVCAGNRLGMLILYGMLNSIDVFLGWMRMKMFASLIYGMYIPKLSFWLSPVVDMARSVLFQIEQIPLPDNYVWNSSWYTDPSRTVKSITATGHLWGLALYAGIGLLVMLLAAYLLKRRKAECAGDLLAFRRMSPVLLILCTVCAGVTAHVGAYVFNWQLRYVMLFLGLICGYYVSLMLLKRQVRVFTLKSILPLAAVCGVFLLALMLTGLDIFGITDRIPQASQVASVTVSPSSYRYKVVTSDPEKIAQILSIQEECLARHAEEENSRPLLTRIFGDEGQSPVVLGEDGIQEMTSLYRILYTMQDGSTMNRIYFVTQSSGCVKDLAQLFSTPELIFSGDYWSDEEPVCMLGEDNSL